MASADDGPQQAATAAAEHARAATAEQQLQAECMASADDRPQQAATTVAAAAAEDARTAAAKQQLQAECMASADDRPQQAATTGSHYSKSTTIIEEDGTASWPLPSSCNATMNISTKLLGAWGLTKACDITLLLPSGERLPRRLLMGTLHGATISQWPSVTQRLLPVRGGDSMFMRASRLQPLEVAVWAMRDGLPVEALPQPQPQPPTKGVLLSKQLDSADLPGHQTIHQVCSCRLSRRR